jgi:hypothetical protein
MHQPIRKEAKLLQGKLDIGIKNFNNEQLKKFAAGVDQVLGTVSKITQQYAEQLGLSEDQAMVLEQGLQTLSGITDIASGNYIQGAMKIVTSLVTVFAEAYSNEKLSKKFEDLREQVEKTISSLEIAGTTLQNLGDSEVVRTLAVIESQLKTVGKDAADLNKKMAGTSYGPRRDTGTTVYKDLTKQVVDLEKEIDNLTQKLLSGNISDDQRKAIEAVLQSYNSLISQIDSITQEITGTTVQTLAEGLAEAFLAGEDAAEAWGNKVNDIIKHIMVNQLTTQMLVDPIKGAIDKLIKDTEGGLTIEEASVFKNSIEELAKSVGPAFEAAREALKTIGIDFTTTSTETQGMTGAIQNITEETAGMIAGQFMAMRVDVKSVIMEMAKGQLIMDQGLSHLARISANTEYNRKLEGMAADLNELTRITKERL